MHWIGFRLSQHVLLASLLAATIAGCAQDAQNALPGAGSGTSVPGNAPIDYHGFPYDIQAG